MSTIGTIVDVLGEIPDAIGLVTRIVERIKAGRPEDRAAIIASMEVAAGHTHDSLERVAARLRAARADEPTRPMALDPTRNGAGQP